MCASRQNRSTVTKLSPKYAQNRAKSANSKRLQCPLTNGWQRDLVEFSTRWWSGRFALANRRIQPLCHLSGVGLDQITTLPPIAGGPSAKYGPIIQSQKNILIDARFSTAKRITTSVRSHERGLGAWLTKKPFPASNKTGRLSARA
jgi:hypothetical protein